MKIFIADDDPMIRQGLRTIVETLGAEVVAEADDAVSAIEGACTCNPEVILMDVSMPGMNGIAAARRLVELKPEVPIILVSQYKNRVYAEEAMRIGIKAVVLKQSAVSELAAAIPAVMAGGTFISPSIKM